MSPVLGFPAVLSAVNVSDLYGAAIVQMGKRERALDGFVIARGLNGVIAAEYLLCFAIRPVRGARLTAVGTDDLAEISPQALAIFHQRELGPRHVLSGGLLHFLGAERLVPVRIVVQQEHI